MATMDAGSRGALPAGFRKIVVGSMAGTVAEWYEFFIYGTAASLVFGELFFPGSDDPLDGVIAAFATYAVGFVARPIGGLVFGHFGDRYGRKKLLQISLLLVGVSTFLMGCLPGFDTWGYFAPIALVTLRFIQGFAVGGEWGGAVLLVTEHSPDHRRGTWAAFPQAAVPLGNLLATIVLLTLNASMSQEMFLAWGWRVGFWLSAVIIIVGYYVRKNLEDAPLFIEALERQKHLEDEQGGLRELLVRHRKQVLAGMAARLGDNTLYYLIVTFTITYLTVSKHMSTQSVLLLMLIGNAFQSGFMIVAGYVSDRIGRRLTYLIGGVTGLAWAIGYFFALETANFWVMLAAIMIGLSVHSLLYAPLGAMLSEMFPTRVRYTGASFCYQVTSIFAGSLAPIIAAMLLSHFGSTVPITIYIVVVLAVSTTTVFVAYKETAGTSLRAVDGRPRGAAGDGDGGSGTMTVATSPAVAAHTLADTRRGQGGRTHRIRGAVLTSCDNERPFAASRPITVCELELAGPGPDEVLVRIEAASVCHSDLSVVDGNRNRPTPMLLGHESAGRIVETGENVTELRVGQRVVMAFLPRCGECAGCRTEGKMPCAAGAATNNAGTLLGGAIRLSRDGEPVFHHLGVSGFATHATVDRRSVTPVDDDVPADVAALLGCAVLTGGGAVLNVARPAPGQTVAVVGLGGVGMAAVLTALSLGAEVIGVDAVESKLDLVRSFGVAHAFTPDEAKRQGLRADLVVEAAGHPQAFETALAITAPGGTTVTVGLPGPEACAAVSPLVLTAEARTVVGSYLGSAVPQRDIPVYAQLWREGRLPVDRLISSRIRLDDINEAMDQLADGSQLRQVIVFDDDHPATTAGPGVGAGRNA